MPDPGDVELVRLGRIGRRLRVAIVAVVVLLLGAVIKPWPGGSAGARESAANDPGPPGSSPTLVVAGASRVVPETSLSPEEAVAAGLCENPDGWRVVSDDVELGRQVRTWLTAEVVYSSAPPTPASIPVTTLASAGISRLGFCRPPEFAQTGQETWTGTIWRQAATPAAQAPSWQLVGRLTPLPGSIGAVADPARALPIAWPPGLYFLEADSAGSASAWLGVLIEGSPKP